MSLQKIHLRKLLQLAYADKSLRISKLREDIRSEISKERGLVSEGGDFHTAFWSDAKKHALGQGDLRALSTARVQDSKGRSRLYPLLASGFLRWWNEGRRWRNEPLNLLPTPQRAQLVLPEVGITIKVENLMGLESGPGFHRIVYPYFAEEPALSAEAARLALWVMSETLTRYQLGDMRVLDVLRARSLGTLDVDLDGTERAQLVRRCQSLVAERETLRKEYP